MLEPIGPDSLSISEKKNTKVMDAMDANEDVQSMMMMSGAAHEGMVHFSK
jgi:hypothetical protein